MSTYTLDAKTTCTSPRYATAPYLLTVHTPWNVNWKCNVIDQNQIFTDINMDVHSSAVNTTWRRFPEYQNMKTMFGYVDICKQLHTSFQIESRYAKTPSVDLGWIRRYYQYNCMVDNIYIMTWRPIMLKTFAFENNNNTIAGGLILKKHKLVKF